MTNGSDFANPSTHQNLDGTHDFSINKGLTKREYFAAMALQGMLSYHSRPDCDGWDRIAKNSVEAADALIKSLNENKEG